MNTYQRAGFKWLVNEILSLQREFELLGWDIDQIADKHKRSPDAIMYKLDYEGLADYNVLYGNYHNLKSHTLVSEKQTSALNLLSEYEDDDETVDDVDDVDDEEYFDNGLDKDDDDDDDDYDDDDYVKDEVENLSERVEGLEESIFEIRDMIKQMMSAFSSQTQSCVSGASL